MSRNQGNLHQRNLVKSLIACGVCLTRQTMTSATVTEVAKPRFDMDSPRWDQTTFMGRLKHFFSITDSRLAISTNKQLDDAKDLVQNYKLGMEPPGTKEEQLRYAQRLYMSAFHPDTGDRQNFIGRMSFQVPGGMLITGAMMQFYRTVPAVVFWQWVNQSFNALVNYTNRNAASSTTNWQIGTAYATATGGALITAIGLNALTKTAPPLIARYVPFAAVAAANCVNIPMMRQQELINGIVIYDDQGKEVGKSRKAAVKGISQVVFSRIFMAAPGMCVLPVIMERLIKYPWFNRVPVLHAPFQVLGVGCFLVFMTPCACALFPQKSTIAVSKLEPDTRKAIQDKYGDSLPYVFYNKGL